MESKKILSKYASDSPLVCLVCGDVARGLNFDVITCMSCKAFFRRNALRTWKELHCQFNNDCIIIQRTRGECSACRLKKCFALGMNPKLIRSSPQRSTTSTNHQQIATKEPKQTWLSQPTTISLLHKDRSTLTFDEWNLLSNIIHAYDEQNIISRTQSTLREQSSLPPKIRSKISNALDIIGSFYKIIQPFLERFPHFYNLPIDIRRIIVQNNLNGAGSFNSMFAANESKALDNEFYIGTCNELYGEDFIKESQRLMTRMESNGTLIKIMISILAFSSNCSIVLPDHTFNLTNASTTNSIFIIRIQDIFIVILWKYLVYQYGFIEAVRRLDNLVKYHLALLNRINEVNSKQHVEMVDIIIEKTAHALTLND